MNLGELFNTFESTAFRLEALDYYDVPDDVDRFRQFVAGEPMTPRTVADHPWLQRVERTTATGRAILRVHAVSRPLSDYVRYELDAYAANVEAGEVVLIADRAAHPDGLADLAEDFWLFDDATVALMRYEADGTFVGVDDASDQLERYRRLRDRALSAAIPYDEFARNEGIVAR